MSTKASPGIAEKLATVQRNLIAPKNQYNNFGKYAYRSCEDITEAVKPLLKEHGLTLTISDTLENIGDRYYVKATVVLRSGDEALEVHAYAREEETKKGMDGSQITGAASSYARKYALNGLFLIDDTKDADSNEAGKVATETAPSFDEKWEGYKAAVQQVDARKNTPQSRQDAPQATERPQQVQSSPTDYSDRDDWKTANRRLHAVAANVVSKNTDEAHAAIKLMAQRVKQVDSHKHMDAEALVKMTAFMESDAFDTFYDKQIKPHMPQPQQEQMN